MKKHFMGNKLISVVGYLARCKDTSQLKEAHNSFFGLGTYLLKSNFRIEDNLRFP